MSGKKGWFYHARQDLLSARALNELEDPICENVTFHCQQCVEKAIKGLLSKRKIRFPKTHDIGQLLGLLDEGSQDLVGKLSPSKALTPYGVYVRYPDSVEVDLSPERVKDILEMTGQCFDLILESAQD